MKNLNFLDLVAVSFMGILLAVVGVNAADNAAVTATVTVQSIAMTLSQTTFDYGTMPSNTSSTTVSLWAGAGIVATNTGNVSEDFDINSANTTAWTLATATSTADIYAHRFCNDTDNVCTTPWTNYSAMTTSPGVLDTAVAAEGTVVFQLQMHTPNPSTIFTQQSSSVTVTASAS